MNTPFLALTDVTVTKEGQPVAKNLNFKMERGQQWAITGYPEESKRLLLEVFTGRTPITRGVVRHYYADDYLAQPEDGTYRNHHDLVCYVPFHHHFRSKSNVQNFYYQQRFNSTEAEDVATVTEYLHSITSKNPVITWTPNHVMELLALDPLADKNLIKLSNGETRRLMIAAALVRNPRLLLLDHPLIGLDVETRHRLNGILDTIARSGTQIILATTPEEIPPCITHVAVIQGDTVIAQGPKREIKWSPPELATSQSQLHQSLHGPIRRLLERRTPEDSKVVVELKNVTVRYGDKLILDGITWRVATGEAWALQGHNGAGKSTLLSLINGDNPQAYSNNITLFGRKRGTGESIWDIKRQIGYVSPELHQYFPKTQTALQVVLSGFFDTVGLFRKVSAAQQETALQWLQLFGMADTASLRLAQLSPDRQRLCLLARAVIKNPTLLILDEPCQGLGPQHRDFFKNLVDELHRIVGTTLIYVSHYAEDIPACVTKYIRLEKGKIAEKTDRHA
ncbi:MAG: ATP-binding cassette domain-containing protein [Parapedobacter sp.]|nr:MAG: ATP-binding cassette domain-containing protein [Parapedobacter sp.]